MKKVSYIILVLFFFSLTSYAQNATGSGHIPDSSTELVVSYFNDHNTKKSSGHLVVNNNSEYTISKAHIYVQVLITWTEDIPGIDPFTMEPLTIERSFSKILVLCDDDIMDIPSQRSITVEKTTRGIVKGGPEKYNDPKKKNKKYNYSVEVTNVTPVPIGLE